MLGSLTVTTFLLIFILDTFTSYSPIKLIENGVKKVLINKKNSETGAHFNSKAPYEKVIYLTFDDGPSSVTDDILFRKALNTEGYRLWDWNVDSRDWELADGKYVKSVIDQIESLEERGVTPVVLLHDQPKTAKYLPQLMTYLANQGYQIKKLDDSVEPVIFECADRCYAINN